jgi:hypothetical protein
MEALAGKIPGGLPSPSVSRLSREGIVQLISAAFVIALVAFMEIHYQELGDAHFFRTADLALDHVWKQLGNDHEAGCPLNIVCPVHPAPH